MGLESGTFVSDLVITNPPTSDLETQGANHLQLVKKVLRNTFPDGSKAGYFPKVLSKISNYTAVIGDDNTLILVDASAGNVVITLPNTLVSPANDSWSIRVVKTDATANTVTVQPQSGTISGNATIVLTSRYNFDFFYWASSTFYDVFPPGFISAAQIGNGAITYAKIQNVAAARLLGNPTGAPAVVSEISLGAGLQFSGSTIVAPNVPLQGLFRNLAIQSISSNQFTVTVDAVAMFDGTNFRVVPVFATGNLGVVGVVNGLDTGVFSANQFYYVWAISNGVTDGVLGSLSSSGPTMPAGYTFKARIGTLRSGAGPSLFGTLQRGRKVSYQVGNLLTTAAPIVVSGAAGSINVPTWSVASLATIVPPSAMSYRIMLWAAASISSSGCMAAPNSNYGQIDSTTNPPPLALRLSAGAQNLGGSVVGEFVQETLNVSYASGVAAAGVSCLGWEESLT